MWLIKFIFLSWFFTQGYSFNFPTETHHLEDITNMKMKKAKIDEGIVTSFSRSDILLIDDNQMDIQTVLKKLQNLAIPLEINYDKEPHSLKEFLNSDYDGTFYITSQNTKLTSINLAKLLKVNQIIRIKPTRALIGKKKLLLKDLVRIYAPEFYPNVKIYYNKHQGEVIQFNNQIVDSRDFFNFIFSDDDDLFDYTELAVNSVVFTAKDILKFLMHIPKVEILFKHKTYSVINFLDQIFNNFEGKFKVIINKKPQNVLNVMKTILSYSVIDGINTKYTKLTTQEILDSLKDVQFLEIYSNLNPAPVPIKTFLKQDLSTLPTIQFIFNGKILDTKMLITLLASKGRIILHDYHDLESIKDEIFIIYKKNSYTLPQFLNVVGNKKVSYKVEHNGKILTQDQLDKLLHERSLNSLTLTQKEIPFDSHSSSSSESLEFNTFSPNEQFFTDSGEHYYYEPDVSGFPHGDLRKHTTYEINEHYDEPDAHHYDETHTQHYDDSHPHHYDETHTTQHYDESHPHHYDETHTEHYDASHPHHYDETHTEHYDESHPHHYDETHTEHYDESHPQHYDETHTTQHYNQPDPHMHISYSTEGISSYPHDGLTEEVSYQTPYNYVDDSHPETDYHHPNIEDLESRHEEIVYLIEDDLGKMEKQIEEVNSDGPNKKSHPEVDLLNPLNLEIKLEEKKRLSDAIEHELDKIKPDGEMPLYSTSETPEEIREKLHEETQLLKERVEEVIDEVVETIEHKPNIENEKKRDTLHKLEEEVKVLEEFLEDTPKKYKPEHVTITSITNPENEPLENASIEKPEYGLNIDVNEDHHHDPKLSGEYEVHEFTPATQNLEENLEVYNVNEPDINEHHSFETEGLNPDHRKSLNFAIPGLPVASNVLKNILGFASKTLTESPITITKIHHPQTHTDYINNIEENVYETPNQFLKASKSNHVHKNNNHAMIKSIPHESSNLDSKLHHKKSYVSSYKAKSKLKLKHAVHHNANIHGGDFGNISYKSSKNNNTKASFTVKSKNQFHYESKPSQHQQKGKVMSISNYKHANLNSENVAINKVITNTKDQFGIINKNSSSQVPRNSFHSKHHVHNHNNLELSSEDKHNFENHHLGSKELTSENLSHIQQEKKDIQHVPDSLTKHHEIYEINKSPETYEISSEDVSSRESYEETTDENLYGTTETHILHGHHPENYKTTTKKYHEIHEYEPQNPETYLQTSHEAHYPRDDPGYIINENIPHDSNEDSKTYIESTEKSYYPQESHEFITKGRIPKHGNSIPHVHHPFTQSQEEFTEFNPYQVNVESTEPGAVDTYHYSTEQPRAPHEEHEHFRHPHHSTHNKKYPKKHIGVEDKPEEYITENVDIIQPHGHHHGYLEEETIPHIIEEEETIPHRKPHGIEEEETTPHRKPHKIDEEETIPHRKPHINEEEETILHRKPHISDEVETISHREPHTIEEEKTIPHRKPHINDEEETILHRKPHLIEEEEEDIRKPVYIIHDHEPDTHEHNIPHKHHDPHHVHIGKEKYPISQEERDIIEHEYPKHPHRTPTTDYIISKEIPEEDSVTDASIGYYKPEVDSEHGYPQDLNLEEEIVDKHYPHPSGRTSHERYEGADHLHRIPHHGDHHNEPEEPISYPQDIYPGHHLVPEESHKYQPNEPVRPGHPKHPHHIYHGHHLDSKEKQPHELHKPKHPHINYENVPDQYIPHHDTIKVDQYPTPRDEENSITESIYEDVTESGKPFRFPKGPSGSSKPVYVSHDGKPVYQITDLPSFEEETQTKHPYNQEYPQNVYSNEENIDWQNSHEIPRDHPSNEFPSTYSPTSEEESGPRVIHHVPMRDMDVEREPNSHQHPNQNWPYLESLEKLNEESPSRYPLDIEENVEGNIYPNYGDKTNKPEYPQHSPIYHHRPENILEEEPVHYKKHHGPQRHDSPSHSEEYPNYLEHNKHQSPRDYPSNEFPSTYSPISEEESVPHVIHYVPTRESIEHSSPQHPNENWPYLETPGKINEESPNRHPSDIGENVEGNIYPVYGDNINKPEYPQHMPIYHHKPKNILNEEPIGYKPHTMVSPSNLEEHPNYLEPNKHRDYVLVDEDNTSPRNIPNQDGSVPYDIRQMHGGNPEIIIHDNGNVVENPDDFIFIAYPSTEEKEAENSPQIPIYQPIQEMPSSKDAENIPQRRPIYRENIESSTVWGNDDPMNPVYNLEDYPVSDKPTAEDSNRYEPYEISSEENQEKIINDINSLLEHVTQLPSYKEKNYILEKVLKNSIIPNNCEVMPFIENKDVTLEDLLEYYAKHYYSGITRSKKMPPVAILKYLLKLGKTAIHCKAHKVLDYILMFINRDPEISLLMKNMESKPDDEDIQTNNPSSSIIKRKRFLKAPKYSSLSGDKRITGRGCDLVPQLIDLNRNLEFLRKNLRSDQPISTPRYNLNSDDDFLDQDQEFEPIKRIFERTIEIAITKAMKEIWPFSHYPDIFNKLNLYRKWSSPKLQFDDGEVEPKGLYRRNPTHKGGLRKKPDYCLEY